LAAEATGQTDVPPYPSLGNLFKGRAAFIERVRESLTRGADGGLAVVATALYGLGGISKTRAAVEYAWAFQEKYTALLFVIADTPEALPRNLAALTGERYLNLPEQVEKEEEARLRAVLDWLRANRGWLLILDNIDTPQPLVEAEQLIGQLAGGHVVITSRLRISRPMSIRSKLTCSTSAMPLISCWSVPRGSGARQPTTRQWHASSLWTSAGSRSRWNTRVHTSSDIGRVSANIASSGRAAATRSSAGPTRRSPITRAPSPPPGRPR
jgi:hypothetical protein